MIPSSPILRRTVVAMQKTSFRLLVLILMGRAFTAECPGAANNTKWAESDYYQRAKDPNDLDLGTNAVVQLICSGTVTSAPTLHFGYPSGVDTNWFILDTAKVSRPGFIIGYSPSGGVSSLHCVVRVLLPAGPYAGDGNTIPNPAVSNGLWMAQTAPSPWHGDIPFHIDASLWSFVALDAQQDTDGDGLKDRWEWKHFNHPTASEPGDDPDSDTVINIDEQAAVTNPNDSNSFLRVEGMPASETEGGVRLAWRAQSNVSYGVDWSTGLVEGSWSFVNLFSNIVLPGTSLFVTNVPEASASAFFRLLVYPPTP